VDETKGKEIAKAGSLAMTALIEAVKANDAKAVKELLENGAEINEKDGLGHTALMWTATLGLTAMARLLLEEGAAVDEKGGMAGFTMLMQAASFEREEMVRMAVEFGANINEKTKFGGTALTMSGDNNRFGMARLLVGLGAVLEEEDKTRYYKIAEMLQEAAEARQRRIDEAERIRVQHAASAGRQDWLKQRAKKLPKPGWPI
jgi:ankyrin repeat protein